MSFYKRDIPIVEVDDDTAKRNIMLFPRHSVGYGLVPRDYDQFPEAMFAAPDEMTLIPQSEWDARYDEQEKQKSSLEHLYLRGNKPAFVNLDQGSDGYCWAYSVGHAMMLDRLRRNLPLVRLNPHSTAAIIKRGVNDGGWCGESAEFATSTGMAPEGTQPGQWPLQSRDVRRCDTPAVRAEMAKFRIDEQWTDLTKRAWDRNLTTAQCATTGFLNLPGPRDYYWWGHSVCGIRWVRIERGSWGQLILNSWRGWGRFGLAVLRGRKAVCDGGLSIRSTVA